MRHSSMNYSVHYIYFKPYLIIMNEKLHISTSSTYQRKGIQPDCIGWTWLLKHETMLSLGAFTALLYATFLNYTTFCIKHSGILNPCLSSMSLSKNKARNKMKT